MIKNTFDHVEEQKDMLVRAIKFKTSMGGSIEILLDAIYKLWFVNAFFNSIKNLGLRGFLWKNNLDFRVPEVD